MRQPLKAFLFFFLYLGIAVLLIFALELYCRAKYPPSVIARIEGHSPALIRDGVLTKEKKAGTIRIVVLGGSAVYGDGVEYNKAFPYRLQKSLNSSQNKKRFEVINRGRCGFNSALILSEEKDFVDLHPDAVLLYMIYNDIPYAIEKNGKILVRINTVSPGKDRNIARYIYSFRNFLQRHLVCLTVIKEKIYQVLYGDVIKGYRLTWKFMPPMSRDDFGQLLNARAENYRNNLKSIIALSKDFSVILAVPHKPCYEFIPDNQKECFSLAYERFTQEIKSLDGQYKNVRALSLKNIFSQSAFQKEYFRDEVHLNPAGSSVVAEALKQDIIKNGI